VATGQNRRQNPQQYRVFSYHNGANLIQDLLGIAGYGILFRLHKKAPFQRMLDYYTCFSKEKQVEAVNE
jgi:hypothetical protein